MNALDQSRCALIEGARPTAGLLSPGSCQLPLPAHKLYVETRGSFGARLFHKPRSPVEVLNDADGEAAHLSRTLIDEDQRRALAAALAGMELGQVADPQLRRALGFATSIEQAVKSVASLCEQRAHLPPVPLGPGLTRLDRAFDRLRGIQVEDGSTCDLIRRYDWPRALFLCDETDRLADANRAEDVIRVLANAKGLVLLIVNSRNVSLVLARLPRWRQMALPPELTDAVWTNF
jgi:hypothetical protein